MILDSSGGPSVIKRSSEVKEGGGRVRDRGDVTVEAEGAEGRVLRLSAEERPKECGQP